MLSGLGVEQLKKGRESSGKLFSSALAFVVGLSAVFTAMGATATVVGAFCCGIALSLRQLLVH